MSLRMKNILKVAAIAVVAVAVDKKLGLTAKVGL